MGRGRSRREPSTVDATYAPGMSSDEGQVSRLVSVVTNEASTPRFNEVFGLDIR